MALRAWKASTLMLAAIGLCALTARSVFAQVGHPPQSSPYRDIRKGHTITAIGGYFGGDGGTLGIGPHDGPLYGGRYDIRTGGTIQLGLGVIYGDLERFIVNPNVPEAERRTGPVKQSVTFAEVALQFNLTGGKTWHRLAPFVGASGGLAISSNTPADNGHGAPPTAHGDCDMSPEDP